MFGAAGAIGMATVRALVAAGHDVVCLVRPGRERSANMFDGAQARFGDATHPEAFARDGVRGERFDAVVSCMASRTGAPKDAWAVDHLAHSTALTAAKTAGVTKFVLLSAICVQKLRLEFQKAKLAFEQNSSVRVSTIRSCAIRRGAIACSPSEDLRLRSRRASRASGCSRC
jgi:divinyl chlorophyllide a 8-vinyl-reductase